MTSSNSSSERLRRLTRLNLRGEHRQIIQDYSNALESLDAAELLVVAHAAHRMNAQKVLAQSIPLLRERMGDNQDVFELRVWHAINSKDRAAVTQLAKDLTSERAAKLSQADVVKFCGVLASIHAWTELERVLQLLSEGEDEQPPGMFVGARALLRMRRRAFVDAYMDAEAALDRSSKKQRNQQRWLLARIARMSGDHETATRMYKAAIQKQNVPACTLYRAAWCAFRANRLPFANTVLTRATEAGAGGSGVDRLRAELAAADRDYATAEAAYARVLERWPDDDDALIGWFDCRAAQVSLPDALSDLDGLLQRHDTLELNVRRIALLRRLGRDEQASHEFAELQRRHPETDVEAFLTRNEQAVAQGGTGNRAATRADKTGPEGGASEDVVDAVEVPRALPAEFQPQWTQDELRQAVGLRQVSAIQLRVIVALILREVKTRYGRRKLGFLWALLEPALHAAVLFAAWSVREKNGFDGMPLLVFLVTGIVPFFLFSQTFTRVGSAVQANKGLLAHRHVTPFDTVLSRAILELLTRIAVLAVFMTGIALYIYEIDFVKPLSLLAALLLLWLTGFGVGLITQALMPVFASMQSMLQVMIRVLYLTSGVIFPLSILPRAVQEMALYNPILHLIQFCRYAFLHLDPISGVNYTYPALITLGLVLVGLLMSTTMRGKILET